MAFIKSIIAFLLTILIAGFCILNAQTIEITWSPVHNTITIPFYTIPLSALIFGFFIGVFSLWLNSGNTRKTKRQQSKHIKTLEKKLAQTASGTNSPNHLQNRQKKPPADFFPALTNKNNA